jgi:uncharacterized protein YjdB
VVKDGVVVLQITPQVEVGIEYVVADPNFDDVLSNVTSIIEAGGDPAESAVVQQAVEDFLSPPTPAPAPTPVAVTGVTLDQATMTLTAEGATGTLVETVAPANATNKSGVVTPLTAGTTTITVTTVDGSFTATCAVTVADKSYFTYTIDSGIATITDYDEAGGLDVVIPSTIDGFPVKHIGDNAFLQ